MASLASRIKKAWNVFTNRDPTAEVENYNYEQVISTRRPDRLRMTRGNERSIVTAIYNRIAIDISLMDLRHVRLDSEKRYASDMDSSLNECFCVSANLDQTGRAFVQDVVMSMFDEGCVAVIPTDIDIKMNTSSYDILELRTAKIQQWYPDRVKVRAYNERLGKYEEIIMPKERVAIIENPFYAIMNEPNSVLQRLIRKLNLLDAIDEQSGSGKLDLIIQLPYVIKTEGQRKQAEKRKNDIEMQLATSKYGIAYTDGTEHITQLNRAVENNLMAQIQYLTTMLYQQLGITQAILENSADAQALLNYQQNILAPISNAIAEEFIRKFISQTGRTQGQSIMFFRDPLKNVSPEKIADMADAFTRNEIMSSNEIRQSIGMKPSSDPAADELRNKNINQSTAQTEEQETEMLGEGALAGAEAEAAITKDESEMSNQEIIDTYEAKMKELDELEKKLKLMESQLR
jgi:hypothetical protein